MPIRILLADDHNIMRDGLRALLERQSDMVVIGEAADGRETIRLATETHPDVVVMDVAMPVMNGVEATRRIVQEQPKTCVVILSMHSDESYVLRSLRAGAKGYMLKDSAQADLITAIRHVAEGRSFFSPKVSRLLHEEYVSELRSRGADDSYELLSAREREILQLIGEGRSNKEVANMLNLSLYTVETHRSHILQKLDLHSIPELILYAVRKGIVT
jgi:DNA-binding NarL/FixJ family response regulator